MAAPDQFQEGSYFRRKNSWEVLFRYAFTPAHPAGDNLSNRHPHTVPIKKLSHVTHETEAECIAEGKGNAEGGGNAEGEGNTKGSDGVDGYIFTPSQKIAKSYKISHLYGESFSVNNSKHLVENLDPEIKYECISNPMLLLPGYYSWWGVYTSDVNWQGPDIDNDQYIPPYLKNPTQSRYGTQEFSVKLHKLLECYQNLQDSAATDIYLLRGGTLRYKREICYVVMVCAKRHKDSAALRDYPALEPNSSLLDLKGLISDNGKVVDYSGNSVPQFTPKYVDTRTSWETLAFAFYFENKEGKLQCHKSLVEHAAIGHETSICPKKVKCGEAWRCPDYQVVLSRLSAYN